MSVKQLELTPSGAKGLNKAKGAARNLTQLFLKAKQRGASATSDVNAYESDNRSR